ncbi:MAG: type I-C CRISPR-associated endonuclease Cas1c [Armatimonadetes bacterium]|nr:type I-C CRISPR-associated endonuclease Cas1c [Armatimonadota bacterium]
MKRLLNTLYVTTEGAYLARDGETVAVRVKREVKMRVPLVGLDGIICLGRVGCSPQLMHLCSRRGVTISFLSETGRFWARVQGPVSGNVLLRREQYRRADDPSGAAELARAFLAAKIANCRAVLLRALRDHPDIPGAAEVSSAADRLRIYLHRLTQPAPLHLCRGFEGEAGKVYFDVFDHLIVAQKEHFSFSRRSRRPPLDPTNALLSFLYAILAHDAASALESVGLDPAVGFLHRDRPGRPGLALDLMEEFRPFLADRLALSLINRQQVRPSGFRTTATGAVLMDDDTRKTVLKAYQTRKQEEIYHPFLDEKIPVGLLLHAQAMLLARHLRGDLDAYPAFFWR